ncbi:MAG: DUF6577 family protein [Candidatus Bathyarchaeia archaeon]
MEWEERALKTLKDRFGGEIFHASEAVSLLEGGLGFRRGTTYRVLKDLADSGLLVRVGYGAYKVGVSGGWVIEPSLTPNMEEARRLLLEKGVEFMITGPSVLVKYMHMLPMRMIHLIYALKGAGEYVAEVLHGKFEVLLNPIIGEVEVALKISEGDLVVVREFSSLYGGKGGVASVERALVDLYFEATRGRIPFQTDEAGRIILTALRNARIDFARLNKSAARRGVDGEFRAIIRAMDIDAPANMKRDFKINRHVEAVLAALGRGI